MGKVPKLKNRAPSSRSRAARRAPSPSIIPLDTSTESTNAHPISKDDSREGPQPELDLSVLGARQGGGVSKKQRQKQKLSRHQRLRKERGMARADAVGDKLAAKVKRSKDKMRVIKSRSAAWEDLNNQVDERPKAVEKASSRRSKKGNADGAEGYRGNNEATVLEDESMALDDAAAAEAALLPAPVLSAPDASIHGGGPETADVIDEIT